MLKERNMAVLYLRDSAQPIFFGRRMVGSKIISKNLSGIINKSEHIKYRIQKLG